MGYEGPAFYDNDAIFKTYMSGRQRKNNPNDTLEKPVILELVGDFTNQRILDLGCGDGSFGREALAKGCQSYLGIEGSRNMVAAAQYILDGTSGKVVHATMETWSYPTQSFDLVISRLAFHYVNDIETIFRQVHQALTENGRIVFSVEHPVLTSCDRRWQGIGKRQDWLVDNYFNAGQRVTTWLGGQVIKYHRTVENYFGSLQRAGFFVENLREAEPQPEQFAGDHDTYERRKRIPLFLIMAGRKSA
jgi:SAM-dependent methyltransferase